MAFRVDPIEHRADSLSNSPRSVGLLKPDLGKNLTDGGTVNFAHWAVSARHHEPNLYHRTTADHAPYRNGSFIGAGWEAPLRHTAQSNRLLAHSLIFRAAAF